MKIDSYIADLLFEHDCVIITDFGGFVATYKPASLDAARQIFYPPAKKIAFNAHLKNNDGLLADYISKKERITYNEACNLIKNVVSHSIQKLEKKEQLKLKKTGILFLDEEKNIQFIPEAGANFLKESFYLNPVSAALLNKDKIYSSAASVKKFSQARQKSRWRIIELMPAAAIAALIFIFPVITKNISTELGSLNPFEYKSSVMTEVPVKSKIEIPAQALENINKKKEPVLSKENILPENEAAETNAPLKETLLVQHENNPYHIIVGCFGIEENAVNYEQELLLYGYEPHRAGKTSRGLTMVSTGSFKNLHEARQGLREVQYAVNKDAWIFSE